MTKIAKPTKAQKKEIEKRVAEKYPKPKPRKKKTLYEKVKSGEATKGKPSAKYYKKGKK